MQRSSIFVLFTSMVLATFSRAGTETPPSEPPENTLARHLPAGVSVRADLAYVPGGHSQQYLDLYLPAGEAESSRPLIIFIHGGGWCVGSKADCPQSLGGLLKKGYVVASVGYRLSQHARFPAQLEDCKAAIRWLRAHAVEFRFDPERIGVVGPSAGGHLVALLGTTGAIRDFDVGENLKFSSAVQAVVDYYGPTDFSQMETHRLADSGVHHDGPDSPEARLLGVEVGAPANAAAVKRANPVAYLSCAAPPFLIIHGDVDPVVPHHQSELLHAGLAELRVPVRLVTVRGGGHGDHFPVAALTVLVEEFFDHYVGRSSASFSWPGAMQSEVPAVGE